MVTRNFVDIDLTVQSEPDATTLLKFRRLLEDKDLTKHAFSTFTSAPYSIKNKEKAREQVWTV